MIPYFLGGFVGYLAVLVLAGVMQWADAHSLSDQPWTTVALMLVVIPACIQALAGDLVARMLRKRLFDHRAHAGLKLFVLGLCVSIVVVGAAAVAFPTLGNRASEAVLISIAAAVVSGLAVSVLRRAKRGSCVSCGYDLGELSAPPRCPECGQATERAAARL